MTMEYRKIPGSDDAVSTIGIGGSHLHESPMKELQSLVDYALERGVNLVDTAMSYPEPMERLGAALEGRRHSVLIQMHLGLTFPNGQYARTRRVDDVKKGFQSQLQGLRTDYADIGFIHYVDEAGDFEEIFSSGLLEYARDLKRAGVIRYLGFASHNVEICRRFLEVDDFDLCMFSVNPAYDFDPVGNVPFPEYDTSGQERLSGAKQRTQFYQECVKRGVGIQVMKAYGGGTLLDKKTSPFNRALSIYQCLQYALDRPAVLSCLLGVKSKREMEEAVGFYGAAREEKDYSDIAGMQHREMQGVCVYCNHCLPCPANIDIAAVHKYLDLFLAGDLLAKEHYLSMSHRAKDCLDCGACEKNCPFHINVRGRMRQAVELLERDIITP